MFHVTLLVALLAAFHVASHLVFHVAFRIAIHIVPRRKVWLSFSSSWSAPETLFSIVRSAARQWTVSALVIKIRNGVQRHVILFLLMWGRPVWKIRQLFLYTSELTIPYCLLLDAVFGCFVELQEVPHMPNADFCLYFQDFDTRVLNEKHARITPLSHCIKILILLRFVAESVSVRTKWLHKMAAC